MDESGDGAGQHAPELREVRRRLALVSVHTRLHLPPQSDKASLVTRLCGLMAAKGKEYRVRVRIRGTLAMVQQRERDCHVCFVNLG
jgi:hypothetical protein